MTCQDHDYGLSIDPTYHTWTLEKRDKTRTYRIWSISGTVKDLPKLLQKLIEETTTDFANIVQGSRPPRREP